MDQMQFDQIMSLLSGLHSVALYLCFGVYLGCGIGVWRLFVLGKNQRSLL